MHVEYGVPRRHTMPSAQAVGKRGGGPGRGFRPWRDERGRLVHPEANIFRPEDHGKQHESGRQLEGDAPHAAEHRSAYRPRVHAALSVRRHDDRQRRRQGVADDEGDHVRLLHPCRKRRGIRREGRQVDRAAASMGHASAAWKRTTRPSGAGSSATVPNSRSGYAVISSQPISPVLPTSSTSNKPTA